MIAEHPIRNGLITAGAIWAGFVIVVAIVEYRALGRTEKAKAGAR